MISLPFYSGSVLNQILQYILANGETFTFNMSSVANSQSPDVPVYHRWFGTATGGKTGEPPSEGSVVFEWLNPGGVVYNP